MYTMGASLQVNGSSPNQLYWIVSRGADEIWYQLISDDPDGFTTRFFGPKYVRSQQKEKTTKKKTHNQKRIKDKIDFSDLRNPHKNFTPLFGEVAKFRTLTEREEQHSRDDDEEERCLPQDT